MSTGPKGNEFIETIELQFSDRARDIIHTSSRGPFDDDLNRKEVTFLMSLSLVM